MPWTSLPSAIFSLGMKTSFAPKRFASIIMDRAPLTLRKRPSSESSPTKTLSSSLLGSTSREQVKSPMAMGKSSPEPSLRKSAGARLTVIFVIGNGYSLLRSAAFTLSLDSRTAIAGSPTKSKLGRPLAMSTSTKIITPSMPQVVRPFTCANICTSIFRSSAGNEKVAPPPLQ